MKRGNTLPFLIALAGLVLFAPGFARASNAGTADKAAADSYDASTAAQMVSGQVRLAKTLDARKAQTGQQFEAVVDGAIHLKDGTELPHGTVLIGTVVADQMHSSGTSRLVLRFTEAKLKDGKVVPVRAMIAGVAAPGDYNDYASDNTAPPVWSQGAQQIDQIGALHDVDLHSRIAGADSGVFVTTKNDIKLAAGSQFSLAIAGSANQS
ncbi:MAG TPA: hypothetical protein VL991_05405 [Terracidiphilus sp.]|jgi:hypothetical protein|nr:hypothetical protein [Terracidiphilus sp.]